MQAHTHRVASWSCAQHTQDSGRSVRRPTPRLEENSASAGRWRRGSDMLTTSSRRYADPAHRLADRADVTSRHGLNERALNRRGMRGRKRDGLLDRGVRERRLVRSHDPVQIRSPGPGLAPVADRAHRIARLRFAERAHGLRLREGIGQLESLVEECLRLAVLRKSGAERAQDGLVEGNVVAERGWRGAVVLMRAGRLPGLRLAARIRETGGRGARRAETTAERPCPSIPRTIPQDACVDAIGRV